MADSLFKEYEKVFDEKEETKEKKTGGFEVAYSPFALQDAVGEKSAKKAWIEYTKLRIDGIEAEELIFKIASKARDMLAIIKGATKEDLGIAKDFPFNKSKRDTKNWQEKSLVDFYTKLIKSYHGSRMGKEELDTALEKLLLSI
jgi:hypothetical protein